MYEALPEPVRRSIAILRAHWSLMGQLPDGGDAIEASVSKVVATFRACDARWTLVGAHAVGMLTQPRATIDFDFVVDDRKLRQVVERLEAELGELDLEDIGAAVRLRAIHVDLIRSGSHALFREALTDTTNVGAWRIPSPELMIVLKFLSAVSPWRGRERRARDMADLMAVFRGAASLRRERMTTLASLVYPGAEREFNDLLERLERGDPISI